MKSIRKFLIESIDGNQLYSAKDIKKVLNKQLPLKKISGNYSQLNGLEDYTINDEDQDWLDNFDEILEDEELSTLRWLFKWFTERYEVELYDWNDQAEEIESMIKMKYKDKTHWFISEESYVKVVSPKKPLRGEDKKIAMVLSEYYEGQREDIKEIAEENGGDDF